MHAAILLAAATLGVDYGWQPLEGGGLEYLIQIEPEVLDALRAGEAVSSDLPPALRDVRSFRITVGRGQLPQLIPPETQPLEQRANPPGGSGWLSSGGRDRPPLQPPRERYADFNFNAETPKPELPARPPSRPAVIDDDPPGQFQADPDTTAPITQTSSYPTEATRSTQSKAEPVGPVSSNTQAPPSPPKPWLPLTASLFGLFISLGGNAYLGMQWWSVRLRCQQLLRSRRAGEGHEEDVFDDGVDEDEEDQDVRAITEEELPRKKASRERQRPES